MNRGEEFFKSSTNLQYLPWSDPHSIVTLKYFIFVALFAACLSASVKFDAPDISSLDRTSSVPIAPP